MGRLISAGAALLAGIMLAGCVDAYGRPNPGASALLGAGIGAVGGAAVGAAATPRYGYAYGGGYGGYGGYGYGGGVYYPPPRPYYGINGFWRPGIGYTPYVACQPIYGGYC